MIEERLTIDGMLSGRKSILCKAFSVQARYRKKFNFNNFPHKFEITRWVKKFKDTGTLIKSSKKEQLPTSSRKLTAKLP